MLPLPVHRVCLCAYVGAEISLRMPLRLWQLRRERSNESNHITFQGGWRRQICVRRWSFHENFPPQLIPLYIASKNSHTYHPPSSLVLLQIPPSVNTLSLVQNVYKFSVKYQLCNFHQFLSQRLGLIIVLSLTQTSTQCTKNCGGETNVVHGRDAFSKTCAVLLPLVLLLWYTHMILPPVYTLKYQKPHPHMPYRQAFRTFPHTSRGTNAPYAGDCVQCHLDRVRMRRLPKQCLTSHRTNCWSIHNDFQLKRSLVRFWKILSLQVIKIIKIVTPVFDRGKCRCFARSQTL